MRKLATTIGVLALLWMAPPGPALSNGTPQRAGGEGASRLPSGDSASEYWDLVARLDSGHRVFARFLVTNEGPGSGSAAAFGHVVRPDGSVARFENAQRRGGWDLSPDGLRIEIKSSILDLASARPKFEYDSDKRGVKLHLWFDPDGALARPSPPAFGGYSLDLLDPSAPVSGTLWLRGMPAPIQVTGSLAATHTWMGRSESELAARRIDFFSLEEETSVYLSELTHPGGERSRWLVVRRGPELVHASQAFELDLEPGARSSRYPVPKALRLRGPGLEGRIGLDPVLLQDDPFEALPAPFRFLLSLKASPRRVWAESPFELRIAPNSGTPGAETLLRGSGITSVSFPNPLPPEISGLMRGPRA